MRVLVTGANGHIGNHVVRELISARHDPVPFVRKSSDVSGLKDLGLTLHYGDVQDRSSLEAAARGCDAIIHLAAVYAMRPKTAEEIMRPAVEGTENILQVAKAIGAKRVVYTSSVVAVGYSSTPAVRSERDWNEDPQVPYFRAKTQSERQAWQLSK